MDNLAELMQLCRLCLVKDQVNVPIFEEQGDIRQIFLKITACLPIKVSKDDSLPKKICDGCLYKLELLYQFWNTTANAEKQLLAWLSQAGMEADSKTTQEAVAIALQTQVTTHSVKEEEIDPPESIPESTDDMTTEAESFIMQPPQLPFEPAGAQFEEPSGFNESQEESHASDDNGAQNDDSQDVDDTEPPPPKRSRRQAAIKAAQLVAQKNDDDDEDEDEEEEDDDEEDVDDPSIEATIPKTEEESEDEDMEDSGTNPEPTDFVSLGTADEEQPGPSGVGKVDTSEAPLYIKIPVIIRTFKPEMNTKGKRIFAKPVTPDIIRLPLIEDFVKTRTKLVGESARNEIKKLLVYREHSYSKFKCRVGRVTCSECGTVFRTAYGLKMHKRFKHRAKPYACKQCEYVFSTPMQLNRHMTFLSSLSEQEHASRSCDLCNVEFYSMSALLYHKKYCKAQNPC